MKPITDLISKKRYLLCLTYLIALLTIFCKPIDSSAQTYQEAVELVPGQQVTTSISYAGDSKWFKIHVDHTCSIQSVITNNSGQIFYDLYDASLNNIYHNSLSNSANFSYKVSSGDYYIRLGDRINVNYSTSSIILTVNLVEQDQWENNDTSSSALTIMPGQLLTGIKIESANDADWYKINIDHTCSIQSVVTNNSGLINYDLYDVSLNRIYHSYFGGPANYSYKVSPGVYYIKLSDFGNINYSTSSITLTANLIEQDQLENNDASSNAYTVTAGQQITGIKIEAANDADWFKINVDHTCSIASQMTDNSGLIYYDLYNASLNNIYHKSFSGSVNFSYKVSPGEYYIRLSDAGGIDYSINSITLKVYLIEQDQWENNDTSSSALTITPGQELTGIKIEATNDTDWFKINVDRTCNISSALTNNSGLIYYDLYNASLNNIYHKYFSSSANFSYKVSPGEYYIRLSDDGGINYSVNSMTLKVDLVDDLSTTLTASADSVIAGDIVYDPSTVTIYANVKNNSASIINNVDVELNLPEGLTLLSPQTSKQIIASIAAGATNQVSWIVLADPRATDSAILTYKVVTTPPSSLGLAAYTNSKQIYVPKALDYEAYLNQTIMGEAVRCILGLEPVNLINGNFYYNHADISVPTTGEPLEFLRDYNSRSTYNGPLGLGWNYNYGYVLTTPATNTAVLQYPDGKVSNFASADGTTFYGTAGSEILVKNADGTYKLTYSNGKVVNFNTSKKLSSIVDCSGNTLSFTYSTNLITVTDSATGRTLKITSNTSGKIITITDPMNHSINITYDASGRLWKVSDLRGKETVYTYDANNLVNSITDASGHRFVYNEYDAKGRVVLQKDGKDKITTIAYYPDETEPHNVVTDPLGNVTTYYYDNNMCATKTVYPDGTNELYGYDEYLNRNEVTDRSGNKTGFVYDAYGNIVGQTDAAYNTLTSTYNSQGKPLTITDAEGNIIQNTYDTNGNLLKIERKLVGETNFTTLTEFQYYPNTVVTGKKANTAKGLVQYIIQHVDNNLANNQTTEFLYDTYGFLDKKIDAMGKTWDYTYDANGRKLDETDPLGNKTIYAYNNDGSLAAQTSPGFDKASTADDVTTANTYFDNGGLQYVTFQDGTKIEYRYDNNDRVIEQYDQMNHKTTIAYDDLGNKDYVIDANNKTTDYSTILSTNTTTVTDAVGKTQTIKYDGNGNIDYSLDWMNNKTDYTYNSINKLASVVDPLGNETIYSYSAISYLDKVTDAKGNVTDYDYDMNGNLLKVTHPNGKSIRYTYDFVGNKLSYINEEGKTWTCTYDKNNRLISVADPYSVVTESYTYYDNGLIETKTDAMNRTTTYEYYANGWLKSQKDSAGNGYTYEYDTDGNKTAVYDAANNQTKYQYNACNWLTKVYTPNDLANPNVTYGYDNVGNKTTVTDALGKVWNYHYDDANRQDKVTDPLNNMDAITYAPSTSSQNYIIKTDASNKSTTIYYNELGQIESVTGSSGSASYGYDANSNLTTVTNGNNNQTSYDFNSMNRLETETDALGNIWEYTYNGDGTLLTKINPEGQEISYQYDDAGRMIEVIYNEQTQVSYEYYADGSRKKMTDANGVTEYTYNTVNGLVATITRTPNGRTAQTITYHYNSRNLIDLITYPDGKTETYTYDERGSLDTAQFTNDAKALDATYDANGRIDSEVLPNDITVDYTYDDAGRLTGITNGTAAKSLYTLAPNGNRDTMVTNEGTTSYQYDDQNRLVRVDYPDGEYEEYTYDNAGNRTNVSGTAIDITYLPTGTATYTYDDEDRLIAYTGSAISTNYTASAISIEYKYDGDGNLCEKTVKDENGNVTAQSQYFYDYSSGLPRILVEYDVKNNKTIDYTYAGRLYGKYDDGSMYYYHQDGLGSILAITDASGNVKNTYTYDAFGDIRAKSETISNSILFTGEMVDEAGNVYLRARLYDPTIGRFLTKDTYSGDINNPQSLNLYTYCENDPVNKVDPSGHDSYVLYTTGFMANFSKQAEWQYNRLVGIEGSENKVHKIEVNNVEAFEDAWNGMGTVDGKSVDINNVVIYSHGNERGFILEEGSSTNAMTINGRNRLNTLDTGNLNDLESKEIKELQLMSCNAGNISAGLSTKGNLAQWFVNNNDVDKVYAYDGSVAFGESSLKVLLTGNYQSRLSNKQCSFKDIEVIYGKDGSRKPQGKLLYTKYLLDLVKAI